MKRCLAILVCITALASLSPAGLVSLNGSDLLTQYTASTGVLSISDTVAVSVEDSSGIQTPYSDVDVQMTTTLSVDNSVAGMVSGVFNGGTISFVDSNGTALLTGDIGQIAIAEVLNDLGLLAGKGSFQVTGGLLASEFPGSIGEVVQLSFNVTPAAVADYASDFSARTNLSLMPVPEPATMAMLGLGGLSLLFRKRRA